MSKDYAEHRENRENLIDIAGLFDDLVKVDRKSTRLNSSHMPKSRMPSSA